MARLTPEELREYNQLLRDEASLTADQVTRLEELKRLITDTTTARKDELDTIIESNKQLKERIDLSSQGFANTERELRLLREQNSERVLVLETLRDEIFISGQISDTTKGQLDAIKERGGAAEKFIQNLGDINNLGDKDLKRIDQLVGGEQRRQAANQRIEKTMKTMSPLQSKAVMMAADLAVLFEEGAESKRKQFLMAKLNLGVDKALTVVFDNMKKQLFAMDEALSSFNKNFQFGPEYTDRLVSNSKALNEFGVSIDEAAKAQASLINNVTDFTMLSGNQQKALEQSAAIAGELGVNLDNFSKGVQNSMKFFGQTAPAAIKTQSELAATARELGISQEKMAADFARSGGAMAKFGSQGVSVFKDLQRVSKITGLEVEKILSIVNKFDTFEGAAEQAGKLNAALGGNFVNAMDLLMATDPVERFDMIRDSILDAGLSFNDMSYYQKQFYKDSLGLADVGELALVLAGDTDMLTGSLNASGEELIEQKKRAQASMSVQEKFAAIIADNSEALIGLAEGLNKVVTGLLKFSPMIKAVVPIMIAYRAITMGLAFAQGLQAVAQLGIASSAGAAALGIGLLGVGIAALVGYMMFASPSKLVLGLFAMGAALIALTLVSGPAAGAMQLLAIPMLQIGTALALIGVGIASATVGISFMVKSFANMFDSISGLTSDTGLSKVADEIEEISSAIARINPVKALAFNSVLTTSAVATTIAAPAMVFANAASSLLPGGTQGGGGTRQPIKLYFDNRELAEFVTEIVGDQIKIVQSSAT
jgi:hypothetical protein